MTYPIPDALDDALISPERYAEWQRQASEDIEGFWEAQAEMLDWTKPWDRVKNTSFAKDDVCIKWFEGGQLNVAHNCVDRWAAVKPDYPAIIWEPDDPHSQRRVLTYAQLKSEVSVCANMLLALGAKAGDPITIYMPMIPEAAIAMLACARIGAVHSVVFGGFSPTALRGRIEDCNSRIIVTADEAIRGGKAVPLKANVDEACAGLAVDAILVLNHTGAHIAMQEDRDHDWRKLATRVSNDCPAKPFDSEHPLFVLYTSGSTGKPKGLQHASAGYLLYAAHTFKHVFDYREGEVFWCTADVGWITGHSYMVYGPLAVGATTLLFEGVPTYPDASRFWQVIDAHRVNQFYTAPTAIRMLMREGNAHLETTKRDSLRVLGSVGEPIGPEAWTWFYEQVGHGRCALVDTWWQTETGGHMLTSLPGAVMPKPGSAGFPYFGVKPVLIGADQKMVQGAGEGALCMAQSWPGQARTIYGDHARFIETYFSDYPGYYFSGDGARCDADGYYWIEGRMDDVVNVSGHRMGTAEIEAVLNDHAAVCESAAVGVAHPLKGQAIYAFVILHEGFTLDETLRAELNASLRHAIGPIAKADKLQEAKGLPKTRSGKIMRRILRTIANGEIQTAQDFEKLGDISTLLNPEVVDKLVAGRL